MTFQVLDHTADVALELVGESPADLCSSLVEGLRWSYAGDEVLSPGGRHELHLVGDCLEALLVALANEVIFLFDARGLLLWELSRVLVGRQGCDWTLDGEAAAVPASALSREVELKAATWHGLRVVELPGGGLTATIVLDV